MNENKDTLTITLSNNGEKISMGINSILKVKLSSNVSTGYSWILIKNDSTKLLLIHEYLLYEAKDDPSLSGKPEQQVYEFNAISEGSLELELNYKRPWEKNVEPLKSFLIEVIINQQN